jgi:putative NIF3 family GTP cyclohydrolase 1 type 2
VLDCGHYGTEKCFTDNMAEVLGKSTDAEIIRSGADINPFSW